jgi:hypothetical protein
VQTHHDDGDTGDDRELARIKAHQCADQAGAGAEGDEYRRESGDEQSRGENRVASHPRRRLRLRDPLERGAGKIDQIRRHQRQHAGRQEAHEARDQRGDNGDVGSHGA